MRSRQRWITLAAILLSCAPLSASPDARVRIRNPGRFGFAPADWWITIYVEPRPEHRLIIIEADGQPGEYRRSDLALDGERAAYVRQLWFKALPEGCYYFHARVFDSTSEVAATISGPVSIRGLSGDSCPE